MSQANPKPTRSYPPPPTDFKERMRVYLQNRPHFPAEEWLKHAGRRVAYSWDGKVILASDPDFDELLKRRAEIGVDPSEVSFGYVPPRRQCLLRGRRV